ncbi:MAG: hypothetical protein V4516_16775 [Pseudomonadota bacterium]
MPGKLQVENVGQSGKSYTVDADRYAAMRAALIGLCPASPPGLTPAEIIAAVVPHLPQDLFPGGDTAGWWMKCVQLDLEAKGILKRAPRPPVRLWKA